MTQPSILSPSDLPRQCLGAELFVSWRSHTQRSGPLTRGVGRWESGASLDHTPRMPPPPPSSAVALRFWLLGTPLPVISVCRSSVCLAGFTCLTSRFHCRLFSLRHHPRTRYIEDFDVWNCIAFLRYPERLATDVYPLRACMLRRGESHSMMWTSLSPTSRVYERMVVLALLALHVNVAVQQRDPINNFCRRWGHQSAVVDNKLYIGGGLVTYDGGSGTPENFSSMSIPVILAILNPSRSRCFFGKSLLTRPPRSLLHLS